jgi:hypothetical protein
MSSTPLGSNPGKNVSTHLGQIVYDSWRSDLFALVFAASDFCASRHQAHTIFIMPRVEQVVCRPGNGNYWPYSRRVTPTRHRDRHGCAWNDEFDIRAGAHASGAAQDCAQWTYLAALAPLAGRNANFVLVAFDRIAVLSAQSAAGDAGNQPSALPGTSGQSPWLAPTLLRQRWTRTRACARDTSPSKHDGRANQIGELSADADCGTSSRRQSRPASVRPAGRYSHPIQPR